MQIKEVQEKLKISSYTLRYYEKMGLIQPYRDENGYRNYSEEDIHKIERIMFLRDINVPIEDIKDILDNKVTFQDVLENHIEKVNTEIESLQYIKNMCEDLKEKNIPLLDQIIEDNQIGDKKVKKRDLKKVFDYFKKDQMVVIGYKPIPRDLLGIIVLSLFISGIFGILIGLAFPNMISYINNQTQNSVQHFQIPFYKASGKLILLSMFISFIVLLIIFIIVQTKLEYVELTDNRISICSYRYQSRKSILKSLITKKENSENKKYSWQDLKRVKIELYFTKGGAWHQGLYTFYVMQFSFIFSDGFEFKIDMGKTVEENPKIAYQILRNKNIDIQASDEVIDFFEQDELKLYDFFENIYHKNGKNR
nr:MerR family transcriptional regulator [uncultured Faecalibacillus sp.]